MNVDTYTALVWFAFCAVMTVTMLVSLHRDRRAERRKRPMLTSDYLAPWVRDGRAPGELPEVERRG